MSKPDPRTTNISLVNPSIPQENLSNLLKRNDLHALIKGNQITIFKGKYSAENARKRDPLSDNNLKKASYKGKLGKNAIKTISARLTTWYESIQEYNRAFAPRSMKERRQLVFITTTLSDQQRHSDQFIKQKILVPFLQLLLYNYPIRHYFWRAEKQKNGNIHFHIIVDTYIHYADIRKYWNNCQNKYGYLDRYYKEKGHIEAPSTDVKLLHNMKNGIRYVLKYVTKSEGDIKVLGRLWGMNDELRAIKKFILIDVNVVMNDVMQLMKEKGTMIYEEEHFLTITLKKNIVDLKKGTAIEAEYINYLLTAYAVLYFADTNLSVSKRFFRYRNPDLEELSKVIKIEV